MIGACRLLGRRPVLAGVLFGLAAVKPQLGLLVPVALISARQWRSVSRRRNHGGAIGPAERRRVRLDGVDRLPGALAGLSALVTHYPAF